MATECRIIWTRQEGAQISSSRQRAGCARKVYAAAETHIGRSRRLRIGLVFANRAVQTVFTCEGFHLKLHAHGLCRWRRARV